MASIPTMSIRVAIVEDKEAIRTGLSYLIDGSDGFTCEARFGDGESALAYPGLGELDVILMDIELPGIDGIEVVRRVKATWPRVQVVMLTVFVDDERIFRSLEAGATGYVLKKTPPAELLDAIRSVNAGGSPMSSQIARRVIETFHRPGVQRDPGASLTDREAEVLRHLVQGLRYREIADTLCISLETVRTHIRHIYEKMQVRSRTEATAKYLRGR